MQIKKNYQDYTEQEFLDLLIKIFNADFATDQDADKAVWEVVQLSEHPSGTDIIFFPQDNIEDSPYGRLKVIKEWRAKNGKPGFKKP